MIEVSKPTVGSQARVFGIRHANSRAADTILYLSSEGPDPSQSQREESSFSKVENVTTLVCSVSSLVKSGTCHVRDPSPSVGVAQLCIVPGAPSWAYKTHDVVGKNP